LKEETKKVKPGADREDDLLIEEEREEKARKRTRGPYRKSHADPKVGKK